MQRRAGGPPGTYLPSNAATPPVVPSSHRGPTTTSSSRRHKKYKWNNPIILLIGASMILVVISWWFFPEAVSKVEHQAESMGQEFVEKARRAEHSLEDMVHSAQQQTTTTKMDAGKRNLDRSASDQASAAMMAQSSKWVDGEKKLKKKLTELYEKQQNGELLGVPVLTRWLGDDFPAWVTPDMDEEQWKKDVEAKYKEMREEEEQWQRDMQRIISQRERDLGITTAR